MFNAPSKMPTLRGVDVTQITSPPPIPGRGLRLHDPEESETNLVDETALEVEIFDLGSALRKSLYNEAIDWELLNQIEAYLFHHGELSFRWLRDIFEDCGEELRPRIATLHAELMNPEGCSMFESSRNRELCYRLLSILQVICPESVSFHASAA